MLGGTAFVGRHFVAAALDGRSRGRPLHAWPDESRALPGRRASSRGPRWEPRRAPGTRIRRRDRHLRLRPARRSRLGRAARRARRSLRVRVEHLGLRRGAAPDRGFAASAPAGPRQRGCRRPLRRAEGALRRRSGGRLPRQRARDPAGPRRRPARLHRPLQLLAAPDRRGRRGACARIAGSARLGDRRPRPRRVDAPDGRGEGDRHLQRGRAGRAARFGELLEECRAISGSDAELTWVDEAFLAAHGVEP